jgi:[ribosomal protein S5]-alanine N-acetyltransferase
MEGSKDGERRCYNKKSRSRCRKVIREATSIIGDQNLSEFTPIVLRTNRLELVAATLDHVCAKLESPECLASLLGAGVEPGWPPGEYDRSAQELFRDRLTEGGVSAIGWYLWYALRCQEPHRLSLLVGAGGYLGPPGEEGEVEIGFSVMPSLQSQGYATEMAEALVRNAFADVRVRKVVAHTTPDNASSIRVLTKSGFRCVGRERESGSILFQISRSIKP